jgi:hypothetical protein
VVTHLAWFPFVTSLKEHMYCNHIFAVNFLNAEILHMQNEIPTRALKMKIDIDCRVSLAPRLLPAEP